jgi:hypothetical protein
MSVTLQVRAPSNADIRLIRHGEVVAHAQNATNLTYTASEPGAYRAELYVQFQGRPRGWIFSNPIYVLKG